jgi:hypothetical protein
MTLDVSVKLTRKKDEIKWDDHIKVCHLHIPGIDSNIGRIGL